MQSKSCNVTMVTWARPSGVETGGWLTRLANQNHCLDYRNHCHSGTSHAQWILSSWLQQTYSSRLRRFRLQCHKRCKDTNFHDTQKALSQTCFGNRSRRKNSQFNHDREISDLGFDVLTCGRPYGNPCCQLAAVKRASADQCQMTVSRAQVYNSLRWHVSKLSADQLLV